MSKRAGGGSYPLRPYRLPVTEQSRRVIELARFMHQIDIARELGIS